MHYKPAKNPRARETIAPAEELSVVLMMDHWKVSHALASSFLLKFIEVKLSGTRENKEEEDK